MLCLWFEPFKILGNGPPMFEPPQVLISILPIRISIDIIIGFEHKIKA